MLTLRAARRRRMLMMREERAIKIVAAAVFAYAATPYAIAAYLRWRLLVYAVMPFDILFCFSRHATRFFDGLMAAFFALLPFR